MDLAVGLIVGLLAFGGASEQGDWARFSQSPYVVKRNRWIASGSPEDQRWVPVGSADDKRYIDLKRFREEHGYRQIWVKQYFNGDEEYSHPEGGFQVATYRYHCGLGQIQIGGVSIFDRNEKRLASSADVYVSSGAPVPGSIAGAMYEIFCGER